VGNEKASHSFSFSQKAPKRGISASCTTRQKQRPNAKAGVAIPAAQAGVTGLFVCVVSGSIAQILHGDPLAWGALTGV